MEADSWRVRSVSSGPKAVGFNILTSKNNASLPACCHLSESVRSSHLHSPSNYQTAVSKETVEPKISRDDREREETERRTSQG